MPAEIEQITYNTDRGVPWHGTGVAVRGLQTAADAMVNGGLDWDVVPTPLLTPDGRTIPDKVANLRSTDGAYLGIVGTGFRHVPNREAFAFADALVAENPDKALYDTAGSLRGGRLVFLSMDLTAVAPIRVNGDASDYATFLLLANGHDGSMALRGTITPIRGVCTNTVNAAIYGTTPTFAIRHRGDVMGKLAAAREVLGLTIDYVRRFEEVAEAAQRVRIGDKRAMTILKRAFRMREQTAANPTTAWYEKQAATRVFDRYQSASDLAPFRGTAWGLVNAAAEFVDHERYMGKTLDRDALDVRCSAILWGNGQAAVSRVLALSAPKLAHPKVVAKA